MQHHRESAFFQSLPNANDVIQDCLPKAIFHKVSHPPATWWMDSGNNTVPWINELHTHCKKHTSTSPRSVSGARLPNAQFRRKLPLLCWPPAHFCRTNTTLINNYYVYLNFNRVQTSWPRGYFSSNGKNFFLIMGNE